ncbi:MAG: tetratricopeptide repeat protein [Myxococcota bacterium]
MENEQESRLVGWKQIATQLGCSERTARRWEQEEQLPVHRQLHDKRSTVYALPSELNGWLTSRSHRAPTGGPDAAPQQSPGANRLWLAVGMAAVLGAGSFWLFRPSVETRDPIAIDLYERGVALWRQRGEVPNGRAIKLLSQAVERDEGFARAWAALASAWLTYPTYTDTVSAQRSLEEALLAADRAVQLDPTLAEPRSVMASVAHRRGDWVSAERILQNAVDADPENPTLLLWFAGHYREVGRVSEAMRLTTSAQALEPNSPPILTEIAMNKNTEGLLDESMTLLDHLWFDLGVETPIVWLGRWFGLTERGDYDEALQWIEKTPFKASSPLLSTYIKRIRDPASPETADFPEQVMNAHRAGFPGWLGFHMLDQSGPLRLL